MPILVYWQEKIIIVCPASLRKQWEAELHDKFGIQSEILDSKNFNAYIRNGKDPFNSKRVIICSYNFAAKHKTEIITKGFDLAIVDEAHKLRNVYRTSARTATAVRDALNGVKKLLLTATPFQNSLLELYGLTTIIDENIFGSEKVSVLNMVRGIISENCASEWLLISRVLFERMFVNTSIIHIVYR